jgi:hypothetical protein
MSGKIFKRVQGDVDDYVDLEIDGVTDLTTVTAVEGYVWRRRTIVELTAAVQDAANRIVRVQLGGAAGWLADARPGDWHVDVKLAFDNAQDLSWPSGVPDWIRVRARPAIPGP